MIIKKVLVTVLNIAHLVALCISPGSASEISWDLMDLFLELTLIKIRKARKCTEKDLSLYRLQPV